MKRKDGLAFTVHCQDKGDGHVTLVPSSYHKEAESQQTAAIIWTSQADASSGLWEKEQGRKRVLTRKQQHWDKTADPCITTQIRTLFPKCSAVSSSHWEDRCCWLLWKILERLWVPKCKITSLFELGCLKTDIADTEFLRVLNPQLHWQTIESIPALLKASKILKKKKKKLCKNPNLMGEDIKTCEKMVKSKATPKSPSKKLWPGTQVNLFSQTQKSNPQSSQK